MIIVLENAQPERAAGASAPEKTLIYSPTFGTFFVDALFRTDHSAFVTLTDHPVADGAAVTDHALMEPFELNMEIGMTDASLGGNLVLGEGQSRSVDAYHLLLEMAAKYEPLTVVTRLRLYERMVITSISTSDDVSTMHALKASVALREIRTVEVSTVTIQQQTSSSKQQKTGGGSGKSSSSGGSKNSSSGSSKAPKPKPKPPKPKPQTSSSANTSKPNSSILYNIFGKIPKPKPTPPKPKPER